MEFVWINIRDKMVTQELLDGFQSGNSVFDSFLKERAGDWQDNSEAATYVFVNKNDIDTGIRIGRTILTKQKMSICRFLKSR